jgi:hypothetical protein
MLAGLINQIHMLDVDSIRTDGGTQSRQSINHDHVNDLVEALGAGATLPPIDVVWDSALTYWLCDGYHRLWAYRQIGRQQIAANIHQGNLEDAQWRSYAANQTHGLRRSPDDKERAIRSALQHPNGATMSDSLIAKHLGVSDKTVTRYRQMLEAAAQIPTMSCRQGADGRTINTANIGRTRRAQQPAQPAVTNDPLSLADIQQIVDELFAVNPPPTQPTQRPTQRPTGAASFERSQQADRQQRDQINTIMRLYEHVLSYSLTVRSLGITTQLLDDQLSLIITQLRSKRV